MKTIWSTLSLLLFLPLAIWGQGTVSGTIIDEELAEPLIGASIYVEGDFAQGTSTDFDGKYQLKLAPGTYNLVITYVGYTDKTITNVEVTDGEVTYLDISMGSSTIEMEEIVVEAKAIERSENALLLLQKKSDKIQDGISAQEMSRFAVSNAAGAMQKVTGATVADGKYIFIRGLGDRYSLTQLNDLIIPSADPYRNAAQLDLIPSRLLDNIITSKTFTPDQPGTFTGGNVNLKTKSFPEQFSLTIGGSIGYNGQNNLVDNFLSEEGNSSDYWGFDGGYRDIPEVLLDPEVRPLLIGGSRRVARLGGPNAEPTAQSVDLASKSTIPQFVPDRITSPLDHSFNIAFGNQYDVFQKKLGVIFSLSFRQSYSRLPDFQTSQWRLLNAQDGVLQGIGDYRDNRTNQTPQLNGLLGLAYKFNSYNSISFNAIYNHLADKVAREVNGERFPNILDPLFIDGQYLSFQERELINYQVSGEHVFPGANEMKLEWKASIANSSQNEPQTRFFEYTINTRNDRFIVGSNDAIDPYYFWRDLEDEQFSGKIDLTIPLANKANKIKVGGFISQKDRVFTEETFRIDFTNDVPFMGDVQDFVAPENMGILDTNDRNGYNLGNFLLNDYNPNNNYNGSEDIYAAYAMFTWQVSEKLKSIVGARLETTDIYVESLADALPDSLRIGTIDQADLLPSINFIYSLQEDMNLRASYSRTLARPNMREIAPFVSIDPIENFFYIGNPQIDKTDVDNVDLRWEWFFNPGEIIAVSAYYKKFTNPIYQEYLPTTNPQIIFDNLESGDLYGIEVEFRKDLGFLADFMSNFKFSTNVSIIESSLEVDQISDFEVAERPFIGQPPFIVNAALSYSDIERGWDATLSYNVVGDRLETIGFSTPDIYNRSRHQLDVNIMKEINNLNLRLSIRNLLDDDYLRSSEYEGTEYVWQRFNRGINLTLGASYTFQ